MDKSPLREWQDSQGLHDWEVVGRTWEVVGRTGLTTDRWLNIRDGAAGLSDDEAKILVALTGDTEIAEKQRRYQLSKVTKAPPVVPPKQP